MFGVRFRDFSRFTFACVWLSLTIFGGVASAKGLWGSASTAPATIALAQMPTQAQATYALILQGGPFPYGKDGIVFGNRERQLPAQRRGYYHEYTVKTPRSRNRGARRIVCGGVAKAAPDICYYTDDHYASFRQIVQ